MPEDLATLVIRFEELAYDTVAERGGRRRQDDRRRGHVRRGRPRERSRDRAPPHRAVPVDEVLPEARAGCRLRVRARPGGRLLRRRSSTSPAGWSSGPVPGSVLTSSEFRDAFGRRPCVRLATPPQPSRPRHRAGRDLGARACRATHPGTGVVAVSDRGAVRYLRSRMASPATTPATRCACSQCTRTPTTRRRRARAPSRSTPPRASAACSCAAPVARRATSSTPRSTHPTCGTTCTRCGWPSCVPASTRSGTRRCTCSGTTTPACPTPRRTRAPTTSPTRRSTRRSDGSSRSSVTSGRRSSSPTPTTASSTRTPITSGCTRSRAPRSTPPATPSASPNRASRGSRRSCTTWAGRSAACWRCTRRTSRTVRRARSSAGSRRASRTTATGSRRSSTSATTSTGAGPRSSRTARRSTRTGSGCGCPTTSCGAFPWEEYVLARSLVDGGVPAGQSAEPETDLFAGIRTGVETGRLAR